MDFSASDVAQGEVTYLAPVVQGTAEADPSSAAVESLFTEAEAWEERDQVSAERLYKRVLDRDPAHVHAYLNLGYVLCEQGRREEAVELYERAIKACGHDDPLIFYNHAVALDGLGRAEEALESYEAALALQPDLLEAHQNAALLCAERGDKKRAIRHFNELRRLERSTGKPW
jgi:tetratricopeptide (TPR) repeat protein